MSGTKTKGEAVIEAIVGAADAKASGAEQKGEATKTSEKGGAKGEKYARRQTLMIPPEDLTIVTDPSHRLYDERAMLPLDPLMIANVVELGVREPVVLEREGGAKLVRDGRQRVRWAIEANKVRKAGDKILVPCVFEDDDDAMATMISLNEVRTSDDIITKAKKASRYIASLVAEGQKRKEAEARCGVIFAAKVGTIRNWLKLLDLDETLQARVADGTISFVGALTAVDLPKDKQAELAADVAAQAAAQPRKTGHHVVGKGSKPSVQVSIKDVAAKVVEKAKAAGVTVNVSRVQDKVDYGNAPKRGALRKALAAVTEKKGSSARLAGAILAFVIGDAEVLKTERAELGDDEKAVLKALISAAKKGEE